MIRTSFRLTVKLQVNDDDDDDDGGDDAGAFGGC